MADEEKKSSNALIKYLLIAIAFLIMLILSAVVSIFTYRMVMDKKEVVIEAEVTVKDSVEFDEFTVYPLREKGIIKFKLQADVSDTKVKEFFNSKKAAVRDKIARNIMMFSIQELKEAYQNAKLHEAIKKELNLMIGDNIKDEGSSSLLGGTHKKKYVVVNVYIPDFSAMAIE